MCLLASRWPRPGNFLPLRGMKPMPTMAAVSGQSCDHAHIAILQPLRNPSSIPLLLATAPLAQHAGTDTCTSDSSHNTIQPAANDETVRHLLEAQAASSATHARIAPNALNELGGSACGAISSSGNNTDRVIKILYFLYC